MIFALVIVLEEKLNVFFASNTGTVVFIMVKLLLKKLKIFLKYRIFNILTHCGGAQPKNQEFF